MIRAPFVTSSDTSIEAAERIDAHLEPLEGVVEHALLAACAVGLTDDEGEQTTGMRHQTYSARRNALVRKGIAIDSGERRLTRSKRKAAVYVHREWARKGKAA